MGIELGRAAVDELGDIVEALRQWQGEDAAMQLHPGDLGWAWQAGARATAAAIRTWRRYGRIVAIGLIDSPTVLRLTTAPDARDNDELARRIAGDVAEPERGVLPAGAVAVEAPGGTRLPDVLTAAGWAIGEPWTPLRRDLTDPVPETDLRVEEIGSAQAPEYTEVHRSSFRSPRFTAALWETMTTGVPYADARSLLGRDEHGTAVAEVTVWSAGPGRPGLLEPMGVHADHQGRGHGRAICIAAAAALRELGASSALVCTPSANTGGIATYLSAGYLRQPERYDRARTAAELPNKENPR